MAEDTGKNKEKSQEFHESQGSTEPCGQNEETKSEKGEKVTTTREVKGEGKTEVYLDKEKESKNWGVWLWSGLAILLLILLLVFYPFKRKSDNIGVISKKHDKSFPVVIEKNDQVINQIINLQQLLKQTRDSFKRAEEKIYASNDTLRATISRLEEQLSNCQKKKTPIAYTPSQRHREITYLPRTISSCPLKGHWIVDDDARTITYAKSDRSIIWKYTPPGYRSIQVDD